TSSAFRRYSASVSGSVASTARKCFKGVDTDVCLPWMDTSRCSLAPGRCGPQISSQDAADRLFLQVGTSEFEGKSSLELLPGGWVPPTDPLKAQRLGGLHPPCEDPYRDRLLILRPANIRSLPQLRH